MEALVFWLTMASMSTAFLSACLAAYYARHAWKQARIANEAWERVRELLDLPRED